MQHDTHDTDSQLAPQWQIEIEGSEDELRRISDAEEETSPSQILIEQEDKGNWRLTLFCNTDADKDVLLSRLPEHAAPMPVPDKNWLAETYRAFPPFEVGRFFLHGSHITEPPAQDKIAIQIDAATAFGTGEHGTTKGCLLGLDMLADDLIPRAILDIGCGSGILAIAAAKFYDCPIIAADIDEEAVRMSAQNAADNHVADKIETMQSTGYDAPRIGQVGPFDLIFSNILAAPLIELAPDLSRNLATGGYCILSGLLLEQENLVLAAHEAMGLKLVTKFPIEEWQTLVMQKVA